MELDILLHGFPGTSDRGTLGWCTVAAVKTSTGIMVLDTGSFGDRALLLSALSEKNIDPLQVNRLFISHLHYDHCLNADIFPNAELVIGTLEWTYANSDIPVQKGDTFVPKHFLPYLSSRKIVFVQEGQYIEDGIRVIELPGHTPGCIGLFFEEQGIVFAADAVKNARDFNFRDPGMSFDSRENGIASMDKVAALANKILPGHDELFTLDYKGINKASHPHVRMISFTDCRIRDGHCHNIPGERQEKKTITVDELIHGAIDMHVHSSPDITPRKQSDIAVAQTAKEAGLKGVLLKCHYGSTTTRAVLAQEAVQGIQVWGGIVLNRSVGGLNSAAVETEITLGAKEVWMPTISSVNHLQFLNKDINLGVPVTDNAGQLLPSVYEILELVAKANVVIATGHLNLAECLLLIKAAQSAGVKKILVTHPEWEVTAMPVDVQKELARQGVMFERCFYASNSPQQLPVEEIVKQIHTVGPDSTVLSSDFGQTFNDESVKGFRRFLQCMLDGGFSSREIELMVKDNPWYLLK